MAFLKSVLVDKVLQEKKLAQVKQNSYRQVEGSRVFANKYKSPVLVISKQQLRQNVQRFTSCMYGFMSHTKV